MRFSIAPSDSSPIYRQIVDQVRRAVAGGQLPAGHSMPSVRAVAEEHTINPTTVSKVYSLLGFEGWLERHRGVGMVVAAVRSVASGERMRRWHQRLEFDPRSVPHGMCTRFCVLW